MGFELPPHDLAGLLELSELSMERWGVPVEEGSWEDRGPRGGQGIPCRAWCIGRGPVYVGFDLRHFDVRTPEGQAKLRCVIGHELGHVEQLAERAWPIMRSPVNVWRYLNDFRNAPLTMRVEWLRMEMDAWDRAEGILASTPSGVVHRELLLRLREEERAGWFRAFGLYQFYGLEEWKR